MRSTTKILCRAAALCFLLTTTFGARAAEEELPGGEPVNAATLAGVGAYNLMDTYLTPGIESRYTGWGLHVTDERTRRLRPLNRRLVRQQLIRLEGARTQNGAGTAIDYAALLAYRLAYHYERPLPLRGMRLLAGAVAGVQGGCIYNTRNTNNPASAKASADLGLSAVLLYNCRIGRFPLALRYQLQLPFAGVAFAPHYNQSYYEMFGLGNGGGLAQFVSFHNRFAVRHYATVDLPVGSLILRAGFLHSSERTRLNSIKSHILSNSFLLGIVKEFVAFGGKRMRDGGPYKSVYYEND